MISEHKRTKPDHVGGPIWPRSSVGIALRLEPCAEAPQ